MLKFVVGPVTGVALQLHWVETFVCTITGMMLSVFLFTYLGEVLRRTVLRRFYKSRRLFSPRTRKITRIWQRFGMAGIAFLTPILLTPIGGTIIATSVGAKRYKIFLYMFISAVIWSLFFTLLLQKIGAAALNFF